MMPAGGARAGARWLRAADAGLRAGRPTIPAATVRDNLATSPLTPSSGVY